MWTGPRIVSASITLSHVEGIAKRLERRLILWDNYPVNDLSMSAEMHLGPLTGRDARLPQAVYGYLNNPLLQESLSFLPLATCFDYAASPARYDPEKSWRSAVRERFGGSALAHWRAIRKFCEADARRHPPSGFSRRETSALRSALGYARKHRRNGWAHELKPWMDRLQKTLTGDKTVTD